ncbi:protein TIFY 10A-like [Macadamia integrifolia]|uniref:protein TIFY 10A-like n=1 Tax=Macadamia integrifolia TaxID=60698 RepID=UPI001C4F8516|nr:protein TIFY 10A-like [Macadamia integrifolia]XP_042517882.1 protein TIFY 10A-like [Macadamia integrifolia]
MSSLSDHSETGSFSGRKTVRLSEKPNFSQTCSLLSQYLKERGTFGDLMNMGVTCNLEGKGKPETCPQTVTTMNLLPNLEISSEASEANMTANRNVQSMDLFPQHAGFGYQPSSIPAEDGLSNLLVKTENKSASSSQMTIFYAGKVLVFDDFPAEKARELMLLASNGSSQKLSNALASTSGNDQLNQTTFSSSTSNLVPTSGTTQERNQLPPRPIASDLPIARKASLHRFLEKRKDRISAKAPYPPVNNLAETTSSKQAEGKTWLGLASDAATSKQLEFQLL